jgi:hypothetical protein
MIAGKHATNCEPFWPETALIWGAGASVGLGLPTTEENSRIISILAGIYPGKGFINKPLNERIRDALSKYNDIPGEIVNSFRDLLLLLFDGDDAEDPEGALKKFKDHVHKMALDHADRFCLNREEKERVKHELYLIHTRYDWAGVRSIAQHMARQWDKDHKRRGTILLMDFLTTIDQLYEADLAIPTRELFQSEKIKSDVKSYLIDKQRLHGVKKCIALISSTIQRILVQERPGKYSKNKLRPYWNIAQCLAELMTEEADHYYKQGLQLDSRQFYFFSYAFISFNWDPVMAWLIFHAHKRINDEKKKLGQSVLRLFNDSGDGIGIRKILDKNDRNSKNILAYMMNEATCQRINDQKYQGIEKTRLIRIGKMLFPHAGLCWRLCPRCGKLFTDFGQKLEDIHSTFAFGPDLLPDINRAWEWRTEEERDQYKRNGYSGDIKCIFCGSFTKPDDTPLILQSAIKPERHYVLEGIFREMGLVVGNARHIVFAGYSLPNDDYIYKCFFESAWAEGVSYEKKKYCTLVDYDMEYCKDSSLPVWLKKNDIFRYLDSSIGSKTTKEVIERFLELFDIDNFRVSLSGIPNVLINRQDMDLKMALIDLLYPKECFTDGFPIHRTMS